MSDKQVDRPIPTQTISPDYYEWLADTFDLRNLDHVATGLKAGGSISNAINGYKRSGFPDQQIADELCMVMQTYSSTATIMQGMPGRNMRKYQPPFFGGVDTYPINWKEPEMFIDIRNGRIYPVIPAGIPEVSIGAEDTVQIPCSPAIVAQVHASLSSMDVDNPPKFWQGAPNYKPDMTWVNTPETQAHPESDMYAAFEYLGQAFEVEQAIHFQPLSKDTETILLNAWELLSRFYGVTALGANLTALCIATAKFYKLEFGVADMVSAVPIDPDSKAYLKANSPNYYTPIPFPRVMEIAWLLMLQGVPVFLPAGDPRSQISQAPEAPAPGQSAISTMGINVDFEISLFKTTYPARLAAFAALNGNKRNLFYYPTADVIPTQTVTSNDLSEVTIPGSQTATPYGAPILQYLAKDGSYALPVFKDNASWNDLAASVTAGLCTEQQCFNLVDQGIACDPAINDLLFIEQDPGVIASWDASCKNAQYLRTLYQRLKGAKS